MLKMDKKDKLSLTNSKKIIKKWQELELNPKEIKFLAEYINNGFNGTQAYLKIAKKGTHITTAGTEANAYLKKPKLKEALDEWKEAFLSVMKDQLEAQIIRHLMARAFYDIEDYYERKKTNKEEDTEEIIEEVLKPLSKLTKEQRMAIDGIEEKYIGTNKNFKWQKYYKLADKDKARTELEKYINMIKDSMDIDVNHDIKTDSTLDKILKSLVKDEV